MKSLCICALIGVSSLKASNLMNESLISNSPFLPPQTGASQNQLLPAPAPAEQNANNDLELRGIFQIGATPPRFNIFDKKENKGHWLELHDTSQDWKIEKYDSSNGSVTVRIGSRTQEIFLSKISDIPLPLISAIGSRRIAPPIINGQQTVADNTRQFSIPPPPPPPPSRALRRSTSNSTTVNTDSGNSTSSVRLSSGRRSTVGSTPSEDNNSSGGNSNQDNNSENNQPDPAPTTETPGPEPTTTVAPPETPTQDEAGNENGNGEDIIFINLPAVPAPPNFEPDPIP